MPCAGRGAGESNECAQVAQAWGQWSEYIRAHPEDPGAAEEADSQDGGGCAEGAADPGEGEAVHGAEAHFGEAARARGGRAALHLSADFEAED